MFPDNDYWLTSIILDSKIIILITTSEKKSSKKN